MLTVITLIENDLPQSNLPTIFGNIGKKKIEGKNVVNLNGEDRSIACNKLMTYAKDWILYLQSDEIIAEGLDKIKKISETTSNNSYVLPILRNKIITKEVRLFKKGYFKNPILEEIIAENKVFLDSTIIGDEPNYDLEKLKEWKNKNPLEIDVYRHLAYYHLRNKEYKEFINVANQYLFRENRVMQQAMMRYYLAIIQNFDNKYDLAIKNVMYGLAENPLMAEFWCCLGDIHFRNKQYDKALSFYENAILLGSRRLKSDEWPVFISKYKNYPLQMIEETKNLIH